MGITTFHKCDSPRTVTVNGNCIFNRKNLLENQFKIYVDANLMLHCGLIVKNKNEYVNNGDLRTHYNEQGIAHTALERCENIFETLRQMGIKMEKIYFYFDGMRPKPKKKRSDYKCAFNANVAIGHFCRGIMNRNNPLYEIRRLKIGEGEHEMFRDRDSNYPSIFITDDTDLHHISYRYTMKTPMDECFMCTRKFVIYDLATLSMEMEQRNENENENTFDDEDDKAFLRFQQFLQNNNDNDTCAPELKIIPRIVYKLLLFLCGSDFTMEFLTPTMINNTLTLLRQTKQNQHQVCDTFKNGEILKKLLNILLNDYEKKFNDREIDYMLNKNNGVAFSFPDPTTNEPQEPYELLIPQEKQLAPCYSIEEIRDVCSKILLLMLIMKCDSRTNWSIVSSPDKSSTTSRKRKNEEIKTTYKYKNGVWPRSTTQSTWASIAKRRHFDQQEITNVVEKYTKSLCFALNYSLLGVYYPGYMDECFNNGTNDNNTYVIIYELIRKELNIDVDSWPTNINELTLKYCQHITHALSEYGERI